MSEGNVLDSHTHIHVHAYTGTYIGLRALHVTSRSRKLCYCGIVFCVDRYVKNNIILFSVELRLIVFDSFIGALLLFLLVGCIVYANRSVTVTGYAIQYPECTVFNFILTSLSSAIYNLLRHSFNITSSSRSFV